VVVFSDRCPFNTADDSPKQALDIDSPISGESAPRCRVSPIIPESSIFPYLRSSGGTLPSPADKNVFLLGRNLESVTNLDNVVAGKYLVAAADCTCHNPGGSCPLKYGSYSLNNMHSSLSASDIASSGA
jgi:hypothetical protein